jgi:hypothetical protein
MLIDTSRRTLADFAGFVPAALRRALLARPELRQIIDDAEAEVVAHRRALRERLDALVREGTGDAGRRAALEVHKAEQAVGAAMAAVADAKARLQAAQGEALRISTTHAAATGRLERDLRDGADARIAQVAEHLRDAADAARHLPVAMFDAITPKVRGALRDLDALALDPLTHAEVGERLDAVLRPIEQAVRVVREDRLRQALDRARRAIGEAIE